MIPLYHVNGHELISLSGKVSSFYKITPSDIEGVTNSKSEKIFTDIEKDIINCNGEIKFYWIEGKVYVNSFSDFKISQGIQKPSTTPLEDFFGTYPQEVNFHENYLTCGTDFVRLFSVKEFPTFIEKLDTLSWPNFVLHIRKQESNKAKGIINFRRKLHYSSLFKGMKDIDSENAYEEAETMLQKLSHGEIALLDIECFIILKAKDKIELDQKSKDLVHEFKSVDSLLFQEEKGLSFFFQSLIPGVEPSFKRSQLCSSNYISKMLPFHIDFIHDGGLKLTARSHKELYWDLFNPTSINYNVLITGTSGQGKSMMANKILKYELGKGTKAVVLDLGNSFYKTTKYYHGEVLSHKFNPLQFRNPTYLKEFVLSVIEDKTTKMEEGRLFSVIQNILELKVSNFDHFLIELEKEFVGISFYFSEIKEYFSDEDIQLNDLTYCDFSDYPEAMKAPLIIYLIEYFKNLEGKKVFVFDECWHLLNKNADYIAECFRTFRKHHASAIAISQNLDDFSITQLGRVIIQNTHWKLLFRQSLSESEFIDYQSIELLESIYSKKGAYSEFLLLSEGIKKPIRYYPTHLEYELFNTNKDESIKFNTYLVENNKYLSFTECIENYCKLKNPFWEFTNED